MSRCADLNRGPTPYHGVALPTELQRQIGAPGGNRTHDHQLKRLLLYRLSYGRKFKYSHKMIVKNYHSNIFLF